MYSTQLLSARHFADLMLLHKKKLSETLTAALPPYLVDAIQKTQLNIRATFNLTAEDIVVIFGEQTYGLNESPKVIGKRLFAKALEMQGVKTVELFANLDMAGSEGGIYRMQIPHPNGKGGYTSLSMLPGWKKGKYRATSGYQSPKMEALNTPMGTISSLYGPIKSANLKAFLSKYYTAANNYAEANIHILREFERQIGLGIDKWVTEDKIDTLIAKSGGMEVMLYLWPPIIQAANLHPKTGIRVPEIKETPFHLYHTEGGCFGRMESVFEDDGLPHLDSKISAKCMHCAFVETTTPQEVIDSGRPITWRAIPRVIAYSLFGVADGHITGGGSIYNPLAQAALSALGIPYFPTTHMLPLDGIGPRVAVFASNALSKIGIPYQPTIKKTALFVYQSSSYNQGLFAQDARVFVASGKASMTDLLLSVGVEGLRNAIENTLSMQLSTHTKVYCPTQLPKQTKAIEV